MHHDTQWTVDVPTKIKKQLLELKKNRPKVFDLATRLFVEMEADGPYRKNWSHFGSLDKGPGIPEDSYHCHLKNGRPTFVACWKIEHKSIKIIRIFYVGTHENAPY